MISAVNPYYNKGNMMKYSSLKESSTGKTIDRLLTIYENCGLNVSVYNLAKNNKGNVFSCAVRIDNTVFASNGKGATPQYSYASGLAELMERIQNLAFDGSIILDDPVAKKIPIEDFLNRKTDLVGEEFFRLYTRENNKIDHKISFEEILNEIQLIYGNEGEINCLQYYDVNNKKVVYLPTQTKKTSNGMAAGNTPEEALVQGISELFERYVQDLTFCKQLVFPIIPESEYMKYDKVTNIIEQYEKLGFTIQIRDASLGKNFPVICVIMIDSKTSQYNVHFGAHPILPVAIERTLTEIAQGRNLTYKDILAKTMLWQDLYNEKNIEPDDIKRNCFKYGHAIVNSKFFTSKPDWEYDSKTWSDTSKNNTNRDILKNIFSLCKKNGFDIYIRDVSFLGFPAYHIVIPQMSFTINHKSIIYYQDCMDNERLFNVANDKVVSNLRKIKNFPGYKKISSYYMLPIYVIKRNYAQVNKLLNQMLKDENIEHLFSKKELKCLYDYMNMFKDKISQDEIREVLNLFYKKDLVEKIEEQWINSDNPVKFWKVPKEDLELANSSKKVFDKLLNLYIKNVPNQENLSEVLNF